MIRKPYPIAKLTGGVDISVDAAFLTDQKSPNLKMVRFDKGLIKKDVGFANFGTGERILNRGMEANSDWIVTGSNVTSNERSNEQAHAGTYSWKAVTNLANHGLLSAPFTVANSVSVTATAWVYSNAGGDFNLQITHANNAVFGGSTAGCNANEWTQLTFTGNAPANAANNRLRIAAKDGADTFYVDDVSLSYTNPTSERIMYIDSFFKIDGTEYLICCTPSRIYLYDSGVWYPVAGSNLFTGDADDQFSSTTYNDVYILTNGQDTVKQWTGGVDTVPTALGGLSDIATAAKCVMAFNSRLVVGFTVESGVNCPYRVRWCGAGEIEHWDPSTYPNDAGFIDLVETPDWIVGFATLIDRLFVFKERSIWELIATRDSNVFEARLIVDGVGTYSEATIVSLGDVLILYGTDDVYLFDGASLKSVGEPLYHWFYTTGEKKVNSSKLNRTACVYIEELGTYVLCLPTSTDEPDWMVSYDVNEESWTQRDFAVTAFGFWSQQDSTLWSEATSAWNSGNWANSWTSQALPPGAPITLLGCANGLILKDDRLQPSNEQMIWETKDFVFGHSQRVVAVSVKCRGNGDFSVYYSTNQGRTWSPGYTFTPDANDFIEEKLYLNLTCDFIRFRITSLASDFQIMWVEPWYIDRSRTESPSTT